MCQAVCIMPLDCPSNSVMCYFTFVMIRNLNIREDGLHAWRHTAKEPGFDDICNLL